MCSHGAADWLVKGGEGVERGVVLLRLVVDLGCVAWLVSLSGRRIDVDIGDLPDQTHDRTQCPRMPHSRSPVDLNGHIQGDQWRGRRLPRRIGARCLLLR